MKNKKQREHARNWICEEEKLQRIGFMCCCSKQRRKKKKEKTAGKNTQMSTIIILIINRHLIFEM